MSRAKPLVVDLGHQTELQRQYTECLRDSDMVVAVGPAGTGKTFLPAVQAITDLVEKRIERIIITRATVPVEGEDLGFLPGTLEEKMAPWTAEIFDIFEEVIGKQEVGNFLKKGQIKVVPLSMMRGRTFKNATIICDEAQNTTPSQIKMLLTRVGHDTKIYLNGDLEQSDLDEPNGLDLVLHLIEEQDLHVPVIEFTDEDVQRSPLCQLWVRAFRRWENTFPE